MNLITSSLSKVGEMVCVSRGAYVSSSRAQTPARGEGKGERKETRPRDLVQSRRRFKEVTTVARDFNTNETQRGDKSRGR